MNKTTIDSIEQGNRIGKTLGDSIAEGLKEPGQGVEKELGLQKALEKAGGSLRVGESSTTDNLNERIKEALFLQSNKEKTFIPVTDPVKPLGENVPPTTLDKPKNEQTELYRRLRGMGFSTSEALAEIDGL